MSASCTRPSRNTLTSDCFGACSSSASGSSPLCVNYAAAPEDEAGRIGDGNYYYQGCAFAGMSTCKANVTAGNCELQCLQSNNKEQQAWVLDVAPPQKDKAETSLFLYVENVVLPTTLKNLSIVGTTEVTRKVPMSFSAGVFEDSTTLERINILDVAIENITSNIFPASLQSLTIQRTKLQQFDPRGNQPFSELRVLDLSENALTEIPIIVYEMRNLSELYLQSNSIHDVHITPAQLAYLKALAKFEGNMTLSSTCQDGYEIFTWNSKTVCYGGDDFLSSDFDSDSTAGTTTSTAGSSKSSMGTVLVIAAVAVFVVAAVVAGMLLLKRAKRKATEPNPVTVKEKKQKMSAKKLRAKFSSTMPMSNDLMDPLQKESSFRKNTFKDIPASHVQMRSLIATNGAIRVSSAEFNKKPVFVAQLKLKDDAAENCEMALDVVPVVSQLRHPQLLSVIGLMYEDTHPVTAVLEYMNLGTLEAHLLRRGKDLTWKNFKLRAALDIAGCLMYLHSKHKLSYGALNGKSVFVDEEKGCKLNTLLASVPEEVAGSVPSTADDDASARGFLAPEILAGESCRSSSDMFAFGVLLAQLDTCRTADEMIRSSWQMRTMVETNPLAISSDVESSHCSTTASAVDEAYGGTSLLTMFPFTEQCPSVVKELACACLQYDPSLRPSASYVVAMLQQLC